MELDLHPVLSLVVCDLSVSSQRAVPDQISWTQKILKPQSVYLQIPSEHYVQPSWNYWRTAETAENQRNSAVGRTAAAVGAHWRAETDRKSVEPLRSKTVRPSACDLKRKTESWTGGAAAVGIDRDGCESTSRCVGKEHLERREGERDTRGALYSDYDYEEIRERRQRVDCTIADKGRETERQRDRQAESLSRLYGRITTQFIENSLSTL